MAYINIFQALLNTLRVVFNLIFISQYGRCCYVFFIIVWFGYPNNSIIVLDSQYAILHIPIITASSELLTLCQSEICSSYNGVLLILLILFEAWYILYVPKKICNEIQELCFKFQGITVPEYADRENHHFIYSSDPSYLSNCIMSLKTSLMTTMPFKHSWLLQYISYQCTGCSYLHLVHQFIHRRKEGH